MFGTTNLTSSLSLGKVISGISKTLGIANQVIPIYKEVKPIIGNARNLFSIMKEFRNDKTVVSTARTNTSNNQIKKINSVNPVFFK